MNKTDIKESIDLHLTKPWIKDFDYNVIKPVDEQVFQNNRNWFGNQVLIMNKNILEIWYTVTKQFWGIHIKASHNNGLGCDVDIHDKFLTGEELWYGYVNIYGELHVFNREDFIKECNYYDWFNEKIRQI